MCRRWRNPFAHTVVEAGDAQAPGCLTTLIGALACVGPASAATVVHVRALGAVGWFLAMDSVALSGGLGEQGGRHDDRVGLG
jgi:hypothetical protein